MSVKQTLEILEKVAEIATLAGLKGHMDEEAMRYFIGIGLEGDRKQAVYVRDTTRSDEHKIVTIYSPCLIVKKGFFAGVSKNQAIELLRLNEALHFARFGIIENEKESIVVASVDHLLDTLDPGEFEASVFCVAQAADMYEKKFGKDEF